MGGTSPIALKAGALDASVQATTAAVVAATISTPLAVTPQVVAATSTDWSNNAATQLTTWKTIAANANRRDLFVQNQSGVVIQVVVVGSPSTIILVGWTGAGLPGQSISLSQFGAVSQGIILICGPSGGAGPQFAALEMSA